MASMTVSAGRQLGVQGSRALKNQLFESISRLSNWLERSKYRGYDTFDGLSSKLLRPLTLDNEILRFVLQQGVRRFPLNLRPLLGIPKGHSTKGMGFLARGFIRLHQATGDEGCRDDTHSFLGVVRAVTKAIARRGKEL